MTETSFALEHSNTSTQDDALLRQEAHAHLAKNASLQLVAELVTRLRAGAFTWWTPEDTRKIWSATTRLRWFEARADLRQKITTELTGLAPKSARNKTPEFQASLIDSVVDDGDVTVKEFDEAFDAVSLSAYGPVIDIWNKFRERMPWDQDTPAHQELLGWLLDAFLASTSSIEGFSRKPILSSHALRTAISGKVWHSRIPLEVRVAIDDLRFQREKAKPGDPFHAIHDLSVATPGIIAANVPLRELTKVLDAAERAMGFAAGGSAGVSRTSPPPLPEAAPAAAGMPGGLGTPGAGGVAATLGGGNPLPPPNPPPAKEKFAFDEEEPEKEKPEKKGKKN